MADEKPKPKIDEKPPAPPPEDKGAFRGLAEIVIGFFIFSTLFGGVISSVNNFLSDKGTLSSGGFSTKNLLISYTRPVASALNPLNLSVLVLEKKISVFAEPGEDEIGIHIQKDMGIIRKGPVTFLGTTYYYVDFKTGVDGWVSGSTIAIVEQDPPLFTRFLLELYSVSVWLTYLLWFGLILLVGGIGFMFRKLTGIRKNIRAQLYPTVTAEEQLFSHNPDWERVLMHVQSVNESDWRLAVIEADIMLSTLLDTMNLPGDSIGEKLKAVEKSDFTTLDLAWDAHKIRNQIAHDGSFVLTQREAKRAIDMFEAVFKEFSFV
jgi:hypothetical protein